MEPTTSLITHPRTGEILDLNKVETDPLLEARDLIADREREWQAMRRSVDDELIRRLDHEGRRSFTFPEFKVDATPPLKKQWDVDALRLTLGELVGEELISAEKARRCLKVKYEAAWRELSTLLSDPRVRERIEACFEEVETPRYLKVTRR